MSSEKKREGPTSTAASTSISRRGFVPAVSLQMFVGVLDHDDTGVDHGSDGDRDAAERHDVGVDALVIHHDEGEEDSERKQENCDQGASEMHAGMRSR